ncbi:MAG: low molecular weight protein arginine phosphatase [Chitinivibrionales bacterium]|nr:low molecular weight protein arginine phosphatase [Chitinivibrionales bacterium]
MKYERIVIVCTGNICRSPIAEALLRARLAKSGHGAVEVSSMGVRGLEGCPATPEARKACSENGIDISAHRARGLVAAELAEADLVFTMDLVQRELVVETCPELESRTFLLAAWPHEAGLNDVVRDPIGRPLRVYRQVFADIDSHVQRILPYLVQGRHRSMS